MIGIYKYTNKFNRKCYIGKSINIERRQKSHLKGIKRGDISYFYNAVRKYGIENFDFDILIECPKENLNYWEKFYIRYYNSNDSRFGYNMTIGGDGISDWSDELRLKQSKVLKGKPSNRRGIKLIDNQLKNLSDSHLRYYKEHPEAIDAQRNRTINRFKEHPEIKEKWTLSCKGRKKINNGIVEKTVSISELSYYLSNGYKLGRLNTGNFKSTSERLKKYYKDHPEAKERCKSGLNKHRVYRDDGTFYMSFDLKN